MTVLLGERIVERARAALSRLFDDAAVGGIDMRVVEGIVHPLMGALREGGVQGWLVLVHAHKSQDVVQHSLHVAGLAANFAHHLGLSDRDCVTLVRAGLLHDIGKARIPRAILDKPGALTAAEMALMRTHAAIGHEILLESGMRDPIVLAVARHHHEMLDGSGYPDRRAGGAIRELVRLTTVCDIYAALTELRPYRTWMTRADALAILREMAPTRLDPVLVQAFEASLDASFARETARTVRLSPPVVRRALCDGGPL
ncbi:HD-GYP domain-containing protein [Methylobacterium terricola]|nr:HD domain-containing phosphohydrolase [Methylobacterium terricola]